MRTNNLLLLPATLLLTTANAALLDDLTNLTASIASVTSTLIEFQNETGPVNTAAIIQNIGWQVGASSANMGCVDTSLPKHNASNSTTSPKIEQAYIDYISSLTDLSEALTDRGRVRHGESDEQVVRQTQSLTHALYLYAKCLYNGNYISQAEAVDTWNAEGDLQQATSEWEEDDNKRPAMVKARERDGKMVRRASCDSLKR